MAEATATAVAEPVAKPETQAAPELETQAPATPAEGTDDSSAVQSETGTEAPVTETPPESEPDRLRREAHEADLKVAEEAAYERAQRELREERQTERQKRNLQAFHTSFGNTAQRQRQTAAQLVIVDTAGEQRNLTQPEINSLFIAPWEAHNGFVLGTREDELNTPTAEAVEQLLTKEQYAKFIEKANGKPAKDFLAEFAEHRALDTRAVKGMSLEDAVDASTKVKSGVAKLRADLAEANEKVKKLQEKYGPEGDPLKDGAIRNGGRDLSYSDLTKMNKAQLSKLPDEEFQAAMARR